MNDGEVVEVTPREASGAAEVTPRAESVPDPPQIDAETKEDSGAIPFGYTYDAMGRRYPCDEYGQLIVAGSKRPTGVPPTVWKGLSSREKAKALAEREGEGRRSASSTDGFGVVAREDAWPRGSDAALSLSLPTPSPTTPT